MTIAVFQSSGNFPDSSDLLNIMLSGADISCLSSLSTLGGMLSGPCALFGSKSFNFFSISSGVVVMLEIDIPFDFEHSSRLGISVPSVV